ncbi:MAG: hypothetical protein AAGD88_05810 [Bacteroidota bacterium]
MKKILLFVALATSLFHLTSCSKEDPMEPILNQQEPEDPIPDEPEEEDNTIPEKATITAPENDETVNQFLDVVLRWGGDDADGDALSYDVLLGTDPTNLESIGEGLAIDSLVIERLETGVEYFWQVITKDGKEGESTSDLSAFTIYEKVLDGDASLSNQQKIDDFVREGYTRVSGTLSITNGGLDITDLVNLNKIDGGLAIFETALFNVDGLANLIQVGGDLFVDNNAVLQNLDSLSRVSTWNGSISIGFNEVLTSIDGIQNMGETLNSVSLAGNNALRSIDIFQNTKALKESLYINQCNSITNLDTFLALQEVGEGIDISDNLSLTSISGLNNLQSAESLEVYDNNNLNEIIGFQNLISLEKSLIIERNGVATVSGFDNLEALSSITIDSNSGLQKIEGFTNLAKVNFVSIGFNLQLQEVAGFNKVNSLDSVFITSNLQLVEFDAFNSLESMNNLTISESSIKELTALQNLKECNELLIGNHSKLTILNLEQLTTAGSIDISRNDVLEQIQFKNLNSVETDFTLKRNLPLVALQGLEQLTSVGGIFEISENFQLTDFCSLSNYASIASNERKEIEVFDNSFNPTTRMIANGECKP